MTHSQYYTSKPPPSSQYWPPSAYHNLDPHDAEVLRSRAISPKVAAARGIRTEGSDMVIPLHNTQGESERDQDQRRPHNPTAGPDGKIRKYLFKAGTQMQVDVQPLSLPCLPNVRVPALIAESALKADATQSAIEPGTFCAMSISGVYGWRSNDMPLTDFGDIPWKIRKRDRITFRRTIYLLFDSDAATNPKVTRARWEFGNFLRRRGARVLLVDVPPTDDGGKQGIDDYLAAGGDLHQLLATAYPLPDIIPAEERADDDAPLSEADRLRQQNAQLRGENAKLKRDNAELVRLATTPHVKEKAKVAAVRLTTIARSKASLGKDMDTQGRVRISAGEISQDFRPRVEKGERQESTNPDGSSPLMTRGTVKRLLEEMRDKHKVLDFKSVEVRKTRAANGLPYYDTEFLVTPATSIAEALRPLAWFAPATPPARTYRRQEPCLHCGEVHSRTIVCDGCGKPVKHLPLPPEQDPEMYAASQHSANETHPVDIETGEILDAPPIAENFDAMDSTPVNSSAGNIHAMDEGLPDDGYAAYPSDFLDPVPTNTYGHDRFTA